MIPNNKGSIWAVCCFCLFLVTSQSFVFAAAQDPYADSDGDGLTDWDEINRYGSRPDLVDTDGDTISDGVEVGLGMSPLTTDSDGDHYSDNYEYANWNPDAERREDRYRLCPYIANLPEFSVEVSGSEVLFDFTFTKGTETKVVNISSTILQDIDQHSWGDQWINDRYSTQGFSTRMGIMSQDFGTDSVVFGTNFAVPWPYLEIMGEGGFGRTTDAIDFDNQEYSYIQLDETEAVDIMEEYENEGWDFHSASFIANVTLSNSFDRTVLLSKIIFDLGNEEQYFLSEAEEYDITIGQGQSYDFIVDFPVGAGDITGGGKKWIYELSTKKHFFRVSDSYHDYSVWDDTGAIAQWVSIDVVMETVQTQCTLVEIVTPETTIREFITSNVDRIDGLSVLDALDMLYIPYTYKYNRMLDLMGHASTPGEKVWAFAYFEIWHDTDTLSDDTNFQTLNMWARGALTVDLQRDTDGDWLVDSLEFRLGTNVTNPDTDYDFADDFIEIAVMLSNPFVQDTDQGGTIDGIEYYENLNASDPSDDKFELPGWYTNHQTLQTAQSAADILLENAIAPSEDQLTWLAPQSSVTNVTYSYDGLKTYVTNTTLALLDSETIECIAIGDADNDGDNDTVMGTYPHGLVLFLENDMDSFILNDPIANFSEMYGAYPVSIKDICIEDVVTIDYNEIVVGTSYFISGWDGDLYRFYGSNATGWNNALIDNIPGGVYSLAIGDVNPDAGNELVVGTGSVEAYPTGSIEVYKYSGGSWGVPTTVRNFDSSRIYVTISDYVDTYLGDEILFCSYSLNSTVGYIGYDIYDFRYENITLNVLTHLISDTDWEKYMWVGLGNSKGTATEIVVAIDSSIPDDDSIEVIIPNPLVISDSLQFPSVFDELVFDDIDNDGYDEVMYLVTDTTSFPESNLTIWDYNGSFYREILVETPEKHITAMTAGDLTNDGEIDYVYGTDLLKLWILPEGALWPGEEMGWICNITLLEPWIFQGELATVNVVIENLGDYAINDLDVRLIHNQQVNNEIETIGMISYVAVESTESIFFEMLPISTGNFTLDIQIDSVSPRISHSSKHNILVRPRSAYQAEIGQALLDLALATRNDTLLDAAMKVGNWLDAVKMDLGMRNVAGSVPDNDFIVFSMESCAWNGDANYTDNLLMGSILSTAKTASFLLNLYHATYQYDPYLDTAMQAAYYLANSSLFLQLDPFYVSSTSWTPESIVEISEIGIFLTNINKEFLYDFFNPTITGVANYLCGISQGNPTATNWLQEPGLTQAASKFLAQIEPTETSAFNYTEYSLGAGEWLDDYVESWKNDLNTSIKNGDTYLYYNSTGLAGLGINLADLRDNLESDYSDAMSVIGNNILARRYESSQGFNWNEEYWTLDIDQLANSVNWDYGAAGISVALAEAYKDTGNQSYREVFLKSAEWIHNSINEIAKGTCGWRQIEALADSIQSMIHIHDVLPVIFVGYFVDPMTSLSGYKFTLSGYVQTIGWHANNVSLTVDLPAVFLLSADQNRTIQLGSIGDPGTALVTWEIYLLRYGDYEVTITGNSTNAGSQINTASLTVTDLGVEKIPLDSNGGPLAFKASNKGFIALQVPDILTETLYNIGEQITIPIEALYSHSNESAYNASIQVGEYGTAVVNGSGLGYAIISDWDPGVKEIPISIRYDKVSGITSGTSNITLFMTFSSLEVVQVNVSVNQAQLGQQVTFQGQVCYGHDGSSVAGAMVTLDGELKTVADENGFFTFEHTETEAGIIDYEISAIADGNNHIVMPSLNQTIQVEWIEFWTPITVLLFLGGAAAVVVVLSLGFRRLRPNELST